MILDFTSFYFGIPEAEPSPVLPPDDAPAAPGAGVPDEGAGGTEEDPGVPAGGTEPGCGTDVAGGTDEPPGAEPGKEGTDEAGVATPSIKLPPELGRSLAKNASANVLTKNTAARAAVTRDRKLAEPVAPNRLPEAPEPKAAPMSAPLPC